MTDLAFASATDLAGLVRGREVSSTELVDLYLDRIGTHDGDLNSYVHVLAERARDAARQADDATARGGDLPPFHGVPVSVKELNFLEGEPATLGTRAWRDATAPFTDEAVARLLRAGMIALGKTNVPELGSTPYSESLLFGPARNPWDVSRTPGGSSGGAAAALAAGLCPVSQGSDGAGSIRIPASSCGLFGLKPARHRVSSAPMLGELGLGMSTNGMLTRTVADSAALLDVLAGYVPGDPGIAPPPPRPFADEVGRDPGTLRVGVVGTSPVGTFAPEVRAAVEATRDVLAELGHEVVDAAVEITDEVRAGVEAAFATLVAALPVPDTELEPLNAWLKEEGRRRTAVDIYGAEFQVQLWARSFVARFHHEFDVLAAPVLTRLPYAIGEVADLPPAEQWQRNIEYVGVTPVPNATGQPAASVPLHWDEGSGMPVGVQFVARPAEEATLFRLAAQLEEARPWADRRPPAFA